MSSWHQPRRAAGAQLARLSQLDAKMRYFLGRIGGRGA